MSLGRPLASKNSRMASVHNCQEEASEALEEILPRWARPAGAVSGVEPSQISIEITANCSYR